MDENMLAELILHLVLDLAGNVIRDSKKNTIISRHIQLVVRNDEEVGKILAGITIPMVEFYPTFTLLPKKQLEKDKAREIGSTSQEF